MHTTQTCSRFFAVICSVRYVCDKYKMLTFVCLHLCVLLSFTYLKLCASLFDVSQMIALLSFSSALKLWYAVLCVSCVSFYQTLSGHFLLCICLTFHIPFCQFHSFNTGFTFFHTADLSHHRLQLPTELSFQSLCPFARFLVLCGFIFIS